MLDFNVHYSNINEVTLLTNLFLLEDDDLSIHIYVILRVEI